MYVTKVVWFCVCMHMCTVKVPVLHAVNFVGVTSQFTSWFETFTDCMQYHLYLDPVQYY